MRALVIGGTGFLGPHIVARLEERGHDVTVLHRGGTERATLGSVPRIHADRDDLESSRDAIERLAPDVVVDVILYTEAKARGLMRALAGIAGRVVVLSSGDVYRNYDGLRGRSKAPPDPVPLGEEAPLRSELYPYRGEEGLAHFRHRDEYDKIPVERLVLGSPALPGTVLRLPAVYGEGDRQHRLRPHLRRMDDGRPAILLEETEAKFPWSRSYVGNVAAAIALAAGDPRAAGRIYNVGEEPALDEESWVRVIGRAAGWGGEVVRLPAEALPEHLRTPNDWRYHLAMETRRLREDLGFREPVELSEALARTVAWERSEPREGTPLPYAAEDEALAALRARAARPE